MINMEYELKNGYIYMYIYEKMHTYHCCFDYMFI